MLNILLCAILTSVSSTASTDDSLSVSFNQREKEALALVEKAEKEHIISKHCKDSLILVINSLRGETYQLGDENESMVSVILGLISGKESCKSESETVTLTRSDDGLTNFPANCGSLL